MARNQHARVFARTTPEVLADAMAILREDASEYAFIGLAGGASAGIAVVTLGVIGGPIAAALIAPMLLLIAVYTLATSSAAVGAGASQLQPDASRAFAEAMGRGMALVRPWLPLVIVLGAASGGIAAIPAHLGHSSRDAIVLVLAAGSGLFALPRSLVATALFEYDLSITDALAASSAVVRMITRPVAMAWGVVLAPALLILALGAIGGIDVVIGAVAGVLFVGAMPAGAALMSLLFRDAATAAHQA